MDVLLIISMTIFSIAKKKMNPIFEKNCSAKNQTQCNFFWKILPQSLTLRWMFLYLAKKLIHIICYCSRSCIRTTHPSFLGKKRIRTLSFFQTNPLNFTFFSPQCLKCPNVHYFINSQVGISLMNLILLTVKMLSFI